MEVRHNRERLPRLPRWPRTYLKLHQHHSHVAANRSCRFCLLPHFDASEAAIIWSCCRALRKRTWGKEEVQLFDLRKPRLHTKKATGYSCMCWHCPRHVMDRIVFVQPSVSSGEKKRQLQKKLQLANNRSLTFGGTWPSHWQTEQKRARVSHHGWTRRLMWLIGPNSTSTDAKDHHATLSTTRKVAASSFSTA